RPVRLSVCPPLRLRSGLPDLRHGDPLAALAVHRALEAGDERVLLEIFAHRLAERAGALAVDDAHEGQRGEVGVVEVALERLLALVGAHAADVDVERDVAARRGQRYRRPARLAARGLRQPLLRLAAQVT